MNKNYTGIDYFRFIAALLIIAIHTSPLGSFSETGDFMLTRIIARVAVPFFFMTSGFFLISRYTCNAEKLGAFIKKTTLIYGVAILLYIPINVTVASITDSSLSFSLSSSASKRLRTELFLTSLSGNMYSSTDTANIVTS